MTQTYDVSTKNGSTDIDVVGERHYHKALKQLIRAHKIKQKKAHFFQAELILEPDNPHAKNGHAISVRWEGKVIGHLPQEIADAYWQLGRLSASNITPTSRCRIWYFIDEENQYQVWARVSLREAHLLLPLNNPPTSNYALLPQQSRIPVIKEEEHLDTLLKYVPAHGHGLVIAVLKTTTGGVNKQYPLLEVHIDNHCVGELSRGMSEKILPVVTHFSKLGFDTSVLAEIKGSSIAVELVLLGAKAHEMSEGALKAPSSSPLPALVPHQDNPDNYEIPDGYTGFTMKKAISAINSVSEKFDSLSTHQDGVAQETKTRSSQNSSPRITPLIPQQTHAVMQKPLEKIATAQSHIQQLSPASRSLLLNGLLWGGVAFGVIYILGGAVSVASQTLAGVGYMFLGLGHLIFSGHLLHCRISDQKNLRTYQDSLKESEQLAQHLTEEDSLILSGLALRIPPEKTPRKWKTILPLALGALFIGFVLLAIGGGETLKEINTIQLP